MYIPCISHIHIYVQILKKKHFSLTCEIEATQNNPLCLCFLRFWEGPHQLVHSNLPWDRKIEKK